MSRVVFALTMWSACSLIIGEIASAQPEDRIPGPSPTPTAPGESPKNGSRSESFPRRSAGPRPVPTQNFVIPAAEFAIGDVPGRPRFQPLDRVTPATPDSFGVVPDPIQLGPLAELRQRESQFPATFTATFDEPCHFPYSGRGRLGELVVRDTLSVYEGMRLAVAQDGRYELSFVAEAPRLPVVMRLQLQLFERVDGVDVLRGTITVAPVVLQADSDLDRHQPSEALLVRRSGYSHLLRDFRLDSPAVAPREFALRRTGTARFGSIPEQAVYAPVMPGDN